MKFPLTDLDTANAWVSKNIIAFLFLFALVGWRLYQSDAGQAQINADIQRTQETIRVMLDQQHDLISGMRSGMASIAREVAVEAIQLNGYESEIITLTRLKDRYERRGDDGEENRQDLYDILDDLRHYEQLKQNIVNRSN